MSIEIWWNRDNVSNLPWLCHTAYFACWRKAQEQVFWVKTKTALCVLLLPHSSSCMCYCFLMKLYWINDLNRKEQTNKTINQHIPKKTLYRQDTGLFLLSVSAGVLSLWQNRHSITWQLSNLCAFRKYSLHVHRIKWWIIRMLTRETALWHVTNVINACWMNPRNFQLDKPL